MTMRVLLIGGYGNFGTLIAQRLAEEPDLTVIVAGRSLEKAQALAERLGAEAARLDIDGDLDRSLREIRPTVVIHTSGPFQTQAYHVAEACIRNGAHYLDLADARDFVVGIDALDEAAKQAGVLVASGASTVPGLTSAIIARHASSFARLDAIDFGIGTAQRTNRGLATVEAVLGYAGKPIRTLIDGRMQEVCGWQDLRWRKFARLGWRPLGNCDIPDLDLFPKHYPSLRTVRFRAGLELPLLHCGLWVLTWLVRVGLVGNLRRFAPQLLRMSNFFDRFGTDDSGFYMEMTGEGLDAAPRRVAFDLAARAGDGLMIPCTPAIVLCLGLASGKITQRGATPCMGLVALDDILAEFGQLKIDWMTR